jgi:hypothetical protein
MRAEDRAFKYVYFIIYGLFWSGRGLNEPEKGDSLKGNISECDLDFVCIRETKKDSFTDEWLNRVSGRKVFFGVPTV